MKGFYFYIITIVLNVCFPQLENNIALNDPGVTNLFFQKDDVSVIPIQKDVIFVLLENEQEGQDEILNEKSCLLSFKIDCSYANVVYFKKEDIYSFPLFEFQNNLGSTDLSPPYFSYIQKS